MMIEQYNVVYLRVSTLLRPLMAQYSTIIEFIARQMQISRFCFTAAWGGDSFGRADVAPCLKSKSQSVSQALDARARSHD